MIKDVYALFSNTDQNLDYRGGSKMKSVKIRKKFGRF